MAANTWLFDGSYGAKFFKVKFSQIRSHLGESKKTMQSFADVVFKELRTHCIAQFYVCFKKIYVTYKKENLERNRGLRVGKRKR